MTRAIHHALRTSERATQLYVDFKLHLALLVHHRPEYRWVWLPKSVRCCIELGLKHEGSWIGSGRRCRDGHSLTRLQSQLFPARDQRFCRHDRVRGQLNINDSFIPRFEWPQRFTKKIERRNSVPGGTDSAQEFFGPVAVPNQFDVPGSVVREARRDGRQSNRVLVNVSHGSWGRRSNCHSFPNAANLSGNCNDENDDHGQPRIGSALFQSCVFRHLLFHLQSEETPQSIRLSQSDE